MSEMSILIAELRPSHRAIEIHHHRLTQMHAWRGPWMATVGQGSLELDSEMGIAMQGFEGGGLLGLKKAGQGRGRSWAVGQSQQKPQPTLPVLQSCPELGQGSLCPQTDQSLSVQCCPGSDGITLKEATLCSRSLKTTSKEGPSLELSAVYTPRSGGKKSLSPRGSTAPGWHITAQLPYFLIPNSGYRSVYLFTGL